MKEYRSAGGERRLWYDPGEIEAIALGELVSANLVPNPNEDDLAVDIEAFVESHLALSLDQHAVLDESVLGVTDFVSGDKPKVLVNRDLTGSALDTEDATPGLIGRWRATLAHEASHVLLHRLLYEIDDMQRGLFQWSDRDSASRKLLRCLKRDVAFGVEARDWREIQANMGMAALLMPKPVFTAAVRQGRESLGISNRSIEAGSATHEQLVMLLAQRFRVSKQAARIRLSTLGVTQPASQRSF